MSKRTLHLFTPAEIAEELALRDAELLRRIDAAEIRNGAWMDKERKAELAPNVLKMVRAFNTLAQLVTKEILAEEGLKRRAEVITTYIKVAKMCYKLRNYNSLNAILAGLMCTPVHRLKKTWREISSKRKRQFSYLTNLMSEEGNWCEYRKEISKRVSTGTTCVIFLGVLLTNVVRYESYQQLKRMNRTRSAVTMPTVAMVKKMSVVETFTVLEAITVRNRLKRLSRMPEMVGEEEEEEGERFFHIMRSTPVTRSDTVGGSKTSSGGSLELSPPSEDGFDLDGGGTPSPDLPGSDWSVEVCRTADRQLGPSQSSWKHTMLRRGRSLEQLLRVCQMADDDDCDIIPLSYDGLSRSLPRISSAPACYHGDKSTTLQLPSDHQQSSSLPRQQTSSRRRHHQHDETEEEVGGEEDSTMMTSYLEILNNKKKRLSSDDTNNEIVCVGGGGGGGDWGGKPHEGSSSTVFSDQTDVDSDSMATSSVGNILSLSPSVAVDNREAFRSLHHHHQTELSECSSVTTGNRQSDHSDESSVSHHHQPELHTNTTKLSDDSNHVQNRIPAIHHHRPPAYRHGNNNEEDRLARTRLRKRFTASDEMDTIHLQTIREDPNTEPSKLLHLYQVLSLGYTLNYTSSPYIREILMDAASRSSRTTASFYEAKNYKRSYVLETCS